MNQYFIKTVILSVCRRKRSMWKVLFISFLCVFLFGGIMLFQDVMNRFQRGNAMRAGGNWFIAAAESYDFIGEHAYFDRESRMAVRASAYDVTNSGEHTSAGYIGSMDNLFFEMSNIKLLKGRLPRTAEEVAVTKQGLSNLSLSFTPGQRIPLTYDTGRVDSAGQPVYCTKDVTVTGILPSYRQNWVEDMDFPDFFLTEAGLKSLETEAEAETFHFYSLGSGHMNVNGKGLYTALTDMAAREGYHNALIYNRASYDVTMWGNQKMYGMAMVLCAILGSMSIIYLFSGCLNDRRSIYFQYLGLGVTRGQLRGMVAIEWTIAFVPSACAAFLFSVICTGIGAKILSGKYHIPELFHISIRSLGMILFFTLGVFLLVLLWCFLGFRVKGLYEMTGQLPLKRLKRLRRKGDRHFRGLMLFLMRRRRLYPGRTAARILFTVVSLSIVMYMGLLWRNRYQEMKGMEKSADIVADFAYESKESNTTGYGLDVDNGTFQLSENRKYDASLSHLSRKEREELRYEMEVDCTMGDSATLSNGMTEKQMEELRKIPGVKRAACMADATDVVIDWDNSMHSKARNDIFIRRVLEQSFWSLQNDEELAPGEYNQAYAMIPNDLSINPQRIYGLEKSEEVDRELRALGGRFDSEAFWAGKQGILFAVDADSFLDMDDEKEHTVEGKLFFDKKKKAYRFQGKEGEKYQYSFEENTVQSGDEVRILDRGHKLLFPVQVVVSTDRNCYNRVIGAVSQIFLEDKNFNFAVNLKSGYYFIGSKNLMKRIQKKRGEALSCHRLSIWLDEGADKNGTEERVTKFLAELNWEFYSKMETKANTKNAWKRQCMISLPVILLVSFCYIFIMCTMERKELEQLRSRLQLMMQQGAAKREILWSRGIFLVRGYLWSIFCILLCGIWQGLDRWSSILQSTGEEISEETGKGVGYFWQELLENWEQYLKSPWIWWIFAIFLFAAVGFTLFGEWRYLRGMGLYDSSRKE